MASYQGPRLPCPVLNQNFPQNNWNPTVERQPGPQFQVSPSLPFQSPERFAHIFPSTPQFSNFPDLMGAGNFLNRPPPPNLPPSTSLPPPHHISPPSQPPFHSQPPPPLTQPPHHQPLPSSHHPFQTPRPQLPIPPSQPPPPHPGPLPPPQTHHPGPPPMSHPPGPPSSHHPGLPPSSYHPGLPPSSHHLGVPPNSHHHPGPPPTTHHSGPSLNSHHSGPPPNSNHSGPPPNLHHHSGPPPTCHHPGPSLNSYHPGPSPNSHHPIPSPNSHNIVPPPNSHHPGHSPNSHNPRPPSLSHNTRPPAPPPQPSSPHQIFRFNSPPPVSTPQFPGSFQRPFRPWNQAPKFRSQRPSFQNRQRMPVPSQQFKDKSQLVDKRRKQKTREFRKIKEDSTEKPFSCDTCDRAFVTENELSDHISLHIKCDHKNCSFEAHPKIVALHKKMQHETGYADRISKLKDDAEIKKWREERRRRFPTAENIRKRQAEQAEKLARGEVLETKEFGKFKRRKEENKDLENSQRKRMKGRHRRRNHDRRRFQEHPCSQPFKVDSETDSDSDSHITLSKFSGLSSLADSAPGDCNQNTNVESLATLNAEIGAISEKHQLTSGQQNVPKSNSDDFNHKDLSFSESNFSGLNSDTPILLDTKNLKDCLKDADKSVCEVPEEKIEKPEKELVVIEESDDDEGPEITKIIKHQDTTNVKNKSDDDEGPEITKIIKHQDTTDVKNNSDDEGPEITQIIKHRATADTKDNSVDRNSEITEIIKPEVKVEVKNGNKSMKPVKKDSIFKGFSNKPDIAGQSRKSTLLEKLLADDIRHERNVILQCIRHIVNNNFFGIASKKS